MPVEAVATLQPASAGLSLRSAWRMVLVLCTAFALSQAYRTVGAIMAAPLQSEFALSAQALGVFSGSFHFAFGAMQLFMGIGIDLHGLRRTVLVAFPMAMAGVYVSSGILIRIGGIVRRRFKHA